MIYQRLSVPLTPQERDALIKLAARERRDPRDQAALELRFALERAGLLTPMTGASASMAGNGNGETLGGIRQPMAVT